MKNAIWLNLSVAICFLCFEASLPTEMRLESSWPLRPRYRPLPQCVWRAFLPITPTYRSEHIFLLLKLMLCWCSRCRCYYMRKLTSADVISRVYTLFIRWESEISIYISPHMPLSVSTDLSAASGEDEPLFQSRQGTSWSFSSLYYFTLQLLLHNLLTARW